MAQRRDNSGGRMLFTDFDASEKGRPAAPLTDNVEPAILDFLNTPIPSIEDVASLLEFGFEDEPAPQRIAAAPPPAPQPSPAPIAEEEDYIPDISPEPPPRRSHPSTARVAPSAPDSGDAGTDAAPASLEEYTRFYPGPPPRRPADNDEDSGFADDADILSQVAPPPKSTGYRHPTGRGRRLDVPPPPRTPYGGIERVEEWYFPPETEEEPQPPPEALSGAEWYEPPTSDSVDEAARGRDTTRRLDDRPGPDTTSLDLFSDFDLDALWEEKLRKAKSGHTETGNTAGIIDMFDGVDIDAVWQEKQRRRKQAGKEGVTPSGRHVPRSTPTDAADNAMTMILDSALLDNESTLIMPPDQRLQSADVPAAPAEKTRRANSKRKKPKRRKSQPVSPKAEENALGFLEDLEDFFSDGKKDKADKEKTGLPTTLDELDIEDLVDAADGGADTARTLEEADTELLDDAEAAPPAARKDPTDALLDSLGDIGDDTGINDNVSAPVIGDGDIDPLATGRGKPRKKAAANAEAEADVLPGEEAPDGEAPPDYGIIDDPDLFTDPAVNGDVKAPVIDDTALARVGKKPNKNVADDTSEAVAAPETDDSPESAVDGGEADETPSAAEGEAEAEEEAVAVDPMDVFANMADMDFSEDDGLDDEMRAALMDDEEPAEEELSEDGLAAMAAAPETPPEGVWGKIRFYARKGLRRVVPAPYLEKIKHMIAWRENWWFYLDIIAAIIASASLAVILSYYIWYKDS